jgi:hypothetical protein
MVEEIVIEALLSMLECLEALVLWEEMHWRLVKVLEVLLEAYKI